jgi:hypothetical protein
MAFVHKQLIIIILRLFSGLDHEKPWQKAAGRYEKSKKIKNRFPGPRKTVQWESWAKR